MAQPVRKVLALAAVILVFPAVSGAEILPDEVALFIDRRELCDSFRNEKPHDPDRKRFVQAAVKELCTGSESELKVLTEKYRKNPDVLRKLDAYRGKTALPSAGR